MMMMMMMRWWQWDKDDDVDDTDGPDHFDTDIYRVFPPLHFLTKWRAFYKVMASYNGRIMQTFLILTPGDGSERNVFEMV
jgi:hypothetical protein